jgi:hypothetical protein
MMRFVLSAEVVVGAVSVVTVLVVVTAAWGTMSLVVMIVAPGIAANADAAAILFVRAAVLFVADSKVFKAAADA